MNRAVAGLHRDHGEKKMGFELGPRRGLYIDMAREKPAGGWPAEDVQHLERLDLVYRSLCAMLFNYVPTSGHPGGSISSGRFAAGIVFGVLDGDVSDPDREDADILSYAAGHKTLGLYALWALRNEVMRIGCPELLPREEKHQLRLEDLLGFRRNPLTRTPLFRKLRVKPLDGHPTPATPFLRLATGASGVGVAASLGLALGAMDYFGRNAPRVHIVEGEGGMTPGRVGEAMAAAATACLGNAILHVDWNQASIDSNRVCRDGEAPGEYVQWNPVEFAMLQDWNAILVPDGFDLGQIAAAQARALAMPNAQPTAIVYRTQKGWQYGIEGRASHGAGHGLCAEGFFKAVAPFAGQAPGRLPCCESAEQRCRGGREAEVLEECFWEALGVIRAALESDAALTGALAGRLRASRRRLDELGRKPRPQAPAVRAVFDLAAQTAGRIPAGLTLAPGQSTTLRGELGRVLQHYNRESGGALLTAAADLYGSTSVSTIAQGFPPGWYNAATNPDARILATGGICEDAMSGMLAGLSTFGKHIGVGSSYGAFIAALGHVAARLHAIGGQARRAIAPEPLKPFFLVCAHAGVKTGEDGPTHADPQALQLLQGNFPLGTLITLTPWDPQEIWPLVSAALARRPAVIAPFVTRPAERVIDRDGRGLAPATDAATGVYRLYAARGKREGTLVLQGSDVGYAFVEQTLPLLRGKGVELDVFYVASAELFDLLPSREQERIYPPAAAREAFGITGFTLPTMERWICSGRGRMLTLHPFREGRFLGSGPAERVLEEAGLDGESQFKAILRYLEK
jgi:transketolase